MLRIYQQKIRNICNALSCVCEWEELGETAVKLEGGARHVRWTSMRLGLHSWGEGLHVFRTQGREKLSAPAM